MPCMISCNVCASPAIVEPEVGLESDAAPGVLVQNAFSRANQPSNSGTTEDRSVFVYEKLNTPVMLRLRLNHAESSYPSFRTSDVPERFASSPMTCSSYCAWLIRL